MKSVIQMMCVAAVVAALGSVAMAGVEIETVPVGNAGNIADTRYTTSGYGAVDYEYNIGKYEVTAGQYCEFLNAVAATDTYWLYSSQMDSTSYGCQITQHGVSGNYTYDFSGRPSGTEANWANRPVNYVSWGDAARFANWLHNGQPGLDSPVPQDADSTEDGSYFLNGAIHDGSLLGVVREDDATWVIPTDDEWYKAAYHKNDGVTGNYYDFPSSSSTATPPGRDMTEATNPGNNANCWGSPYIYPIESPSYTTIVGEFELSESPYDTFDQGGNVYEWTEAIMSWPNRGLRGGAFDRNSTYLHASDRGYYHPAYKHRIIGLRVARVPEPASMALLALGGAGILMRRRRAG